MPLLRATRFPLTLTTLLAILLCSACGGGAGGGITGGIGPLGGRVPSSPAGVGSTAKWTYTATGTVSGNGQFFNLTGTRTVTGDISWTGRLNGDALHVTTDDQALRVTETGQVFGVSAEYYDHFTEDGEQYRYGTRVGGGSVLWLSSRVLIAEADMAIGKVYGPLALTDASGTRHVTSLKVEGIESVSTALGTLNAYRLRSTGTVTPLSGPVSYIDVVTLQRPDMGVLQQTETITQTASGQLATQIVTWRVQTYQSHSRTGPAPSGVSAPDVALFFVSGHRIDFGTGSLVFDGEPEPEYLSRFGDCGPFIHQALEARGYDVDSFFYSDNAQDVPQGGGNTSPGPAYQRLLSELLSAATAWGPSTQIVVIAHSHGGVSAHAALRDLNVALGSNRVLLVDLDTNRLEFGTLHGCAAWGGCTDDVLGLEFGIQNVVYPCVEANLEIRSGTPLVRDLFNNKRHVTGSSAGIETHTGVDTHSTCHRPGYDGMDLTLSWLLQKLSD